jgi:hypothetical protein
MAYIAASLVIVLIVALWLVGRRAMTYVRTHPELITNGTPLAYQLCQNTLQHIIARYKEIAGQQVASAVIAWQAPGGTVYTISRTGIEERRDPNRPPYTLAWADIGGVGVRMQPGFKVLDHDRDGRADSRVTTGYAFHLLIVPVTGDTMVIFIPTNNRTDAVNFVAHTLALAEIMQKRINVFGFDRPPAPRRQRVSRF